MRGASSLQTPCHRPDADGARGPAVRRQFSLRCWREPSKSTRRATHSPCQGLFCPEGTQGRGGVSGLEAQPSEINFQNFLLLSRTFAALCRQTAQVTRLASRLIRQVDNHSFSNSVAFREPNFQRSMMFGSSTWMVRSVPYGAFVARKTTIQLDLITLWIAM